MYLPQTVAPFVLQIPQTINTCMAEHFTAMRENQLHHKHSNFSAHLPSQLQFGADAQHPPQAQAADEGPIPQPCCSPPASPDSHCSTPRRSEHESPDSGRFSPVYEATSPSFSPRGSQDMDCTPGQAAGVDEPAPLPPADQDTVEQETVVPLQATVTDAAASADAQSHASAFTEPEQSATVVSAHESKGGSNAQEAAHPIRPSTRQQKPSGSRFCFGRPAAAPGQAQAASTAAPATPAATAQDAAPGSAQATNSSSGHPVPAEGAGQELATDLGITGESIALDDSACPARQDAAGPAATADLGSTVEGQALGDSAHNREDAALPPAAAEASEAVAKHLDAEAVHAETMSSASEVCNPELQPTFAWSHSGSAASQNSGSSFFGSSSAFASEPAASQKSGSSLFGSTAQAGGSSAKQPKGTSSRRGSSRRQASKGRSAAKQPGSVPIACEQEQSATAGSAT